jgi:hypothetical protein
MLCRYDSSRNKVILYVLIQLILPPGGYCTQGLSFILAYCMPARVVASVQPGLKLQNHVLLVRMAIAQDWCPPINALFAMLECTVMVTGLFRPEAFARRVF